MALVVKNWPAMAGEVRDPYSTLGKNWPAMAGEVRDPYPTLGKNWPTMAGEVRDPYSTLGLGRSLREGHSNPLQCSCLENPTDGEI